MSMMPSDPDGRPEPPATAAPGGETAPAAEERLQPAPAPNEGLPPIAPTGDRPRRRRRRRRRHGPPRVDAAPATGAAPAQEPAVQPPAAEGASPATAGETALTPLPAENGPRKRRRRRRRPRPKDAGVAAATDEAAPASAAAQPEAPRRDQAPRHRERRRGPREERPRDRENRREGASGPRAGEERDAGARGRRGPREERGARPPKTRRHGRDRDDFRNKPEPKLSRLESVVDRGFEDVADPAAEGATRRVDWTILKRSTVDQRAAQALSAIYVLRRDGIDTEFTQLSAARAAVNKTISHPEKLTLSKADHAAARSGKK